MTFEKDYHTKVRTDCTQHWCKWSPLTTRYTNRFKNHCFAHLLWAYWKYLWKSLNWGLWVHNEPIYQACICIPEFSRSRKQFNDVCSMFLQSLIPCKTYLSKWMTYFVVMNLSWSSWLTTELTSTEFKNPSL